MSNYKYTATIEPEPFQLTITECQDAEWLISTKGALPISGATTEDVLRILKGMLEAQIKARDEDET